jgi:hypothetical protein
MGAAGTIGRPGGFLIRHQETEMTRKPQQVPDRQVPENLKEQDRHGNIHQNTTNQGYQQDR